jgi:hypothetical protein
VPLENNLLTQKFGKAEFSFEEGFGAWIMKEVFGYFLGDASFLTDLAVDGIVKDSFGKTITQEGEVVQGDIMELANRSIKMELITLTDQNIYLFYKKGLRHKKTKLILVPLKYAKDAKVEGALFKQVVVSFEVPNKKKSKATSFDLKLSVSSPHTWVNMTKCAISKPLLDTTEEKVIGCIDIFKSRARHGLYFTKDRVIVAKYGISRLWFLWIAPMIFVGMLFLGLSPLAFFSPKYGFSVFSQALIIGILLTVVPFLVFQVADSWKYKMLLKLGPDDVLGNDKKNFEIPYSLMKQAELKKGGTLSCNKLFITTNSEEYQFDIMNKKLLDYHTSLIKWLLSKSKLILPNIKENK